MHRFLYSLPSVLFLVLVTVSPLQAQDDSDQYLLSERTYNRLSAIQELMDKGSYARAEQDLKELLDDVRDNNYEVAVTYQTLGYVYSSTDRYDAAAEAFIKAIEKRALPPDVTHNLNYNIAQLLIHAGDYKQGLLYLDKWFAEEPAAPPEVHVLAATAYYQLNDFRSLIPHIQTAIDRSDKPEKPWFDLLLAAYFELKDFRNAADLLTEMLERYPESRDYWLQLVGVYQQLDRNKQSLAVMELALEKGILEKEEIIQLAQMYLQEDLPFKAAKLLQEKIDNNEIGKNRDNLELLANSWQLAQETERAAATLKQLADISNDTAVYYRLGQIYFELERWQDCIEILEKVIDDDDFENQANATLLAGIAAYHLEDSSRSRKALNKALGYDSTRQQAEWWLDKLETRDESGISG